MPVFADNTNQGKPFWHQAAGAGAGASYHSHADGSQQCMHTGSWHGFRSSEAACDQWLLHCWLLGGPGGGRPHQGSLMTHHHTIVLWHVIRVT